jgi:hypothetical protein
MNSPFFAACLEKQSTNPTTFKGTQEEYVAIRQARPTLNVYPEAPWVAGFEFQLLSPMDKQAVAQKKNN